MAETEEKRETKPRDLLQRLIFSDLQRKIEESTGDEESIELSLGLSLNGRFGVDPKGAEFLRRSSSVTDIAFTKEKSNGACVVPPLIRTCSLPTESEVDWRKRKEIQSLRRMEVKKKRVEKLRNLRKQGIVESNSGENLKSQSQWEGMIPPPPSSQGSIGSRGSGSSGISESGSQPNQGMNGYTEARTPATTIHSLPKLNEQKVEVTPTKKSAEFVGAAMENQSLKVAVSNAEAMEIMRNMLVDMPCVSTRGIGSNGKTVEGFLYRYRKGEEVRIVCVCHGSFLSPAEFVKHGGGGDGDVAHPLKHIVVNPSPLL